MRHVDDAQAPGHETIDQGQHIRAADGIDHRRCLIEGDEPAPHGDGAGDSQALLLAG